MEPSPIELSRDNDSNDCTMHETAYPAYNDVETKSTCGIMRKILIRRI